MKDDWDVEQSRQKKQHVQRPRGRQRPGLFEGCMGACSWNKVGTRVGRIARKEVREERRTGPRTVRSGLRS